MRHKRVTVCNVYACTYYRRKEVYGILQTKKKRSEEGMEGTIRSLGVNNFPNVAFMGVVTFIATHDANKKSFPSL